MTKRLIIILSAIATTLAGLWLLGPWHQAREIPEVISFSPLDGAVNISVDTRIEIAFRSKIESENLEIQIKPEVAFQTSFEENQTLVVISPENLLAYGTAYQIRVSDKPSRQALADWRFTTIPGQEDPQLREEIDKFQTSRYPLLPFSPPNNASFYFIYSGPLQLKIFLKGNLGQTKQEALDWITSQGVSPTTHQIEWITPEP